MATFFKETKGMISDKKKVHTRRISRNDSLVERTGSGSSLTALRNSSYPFPRDNRFSFQDTIDSNEEFNKMLAELKFKDQMLRQKSIGALIEFIHVQTQTLNLEILSKFLEGVILELSRFASSRGDSDRQLVLNIVEAMIDLEIEQLKSEKKISRIGLLIRDCQTGSTDPQVITDAAKLLGKLLRIGGDQAFECAEKELENSVISFPYPEKRYMSSLNIREIALSTPNIFHILQVEQFHNNISEVLKDPNLQTREAAVNALRACLDVISSREHHFTADLYKKFFHSVEMALKDKDVKDVSPGIHGALLTLGELLINSENYLPHMWKYAAEIFHKFKESKDKNIKKSVVTLLPRSAAVTPSEFSKLHLNSTVTFLLDIQKVKELRGTAYISLGNLALATKSYFKPYFEVVISAIKSGLQMKKKGEFAPEVLTCTGLLAQASGSQLRSQMNLLLPELFNSGLSERLAEALEQIGTAIPAILPEIQELLLGQIAHVLGFHNSDKTTYGSEKLKEKNSHEKGTPIESEIEGLALGLGILATFDFESNTNVRNCAPFLERLLHECVIGFLDHQNESVRKAAALTLAKKIKISNSKASADVVEKLLIVGITDRDPSIRQVVFSTLDSKFDQHLSHPDNIRSLFLALNDESFEVREMVIVVIGRLTVRNPAYVMPSLRATMIQLLGNLHFGADNKHQMQSARLLSHLVLASQRLIKPYVPTVLQVLLPLVKSTSHASLYVLTALGALSFAGELELAPHFNQLMPIILENLQNQSSTFRREVALTALTRLASNTGNVISPYFTHPELLHILVTGVKTEVSRPIRQQILQCFATLGALDPYKWKMIEQKHLGQSQDIYLATGLTKGNTSTTMTESWTRGDYYPKIAIDALVRILCNSSLSVHYQKAIRAIVFIMKKYKTQIESKIYHKIMPPIIYIMQSRDTNLRTIVLRELKELLSIASKELSEYLDEIFEIIGENWSASDQTTMIGIVEEVGRQLQQEFRVYLPRLIPSMLKVLYLDTSKDQVVTQHMLRALEGFSSNLEHYLHLIVPATATLLEADNLDVQKAAMQTLSKLCQLNSDYASRIIHPIIRLLDTSGDIRTSNKENPTGLSELRQNAMQTLCVLVVQLQADYTIFIPMVNQVISKLPQTEAVVIQYKMLVNQLIKPSSSSSSNSNTGASSSSHHHTGSGGANSGVSAISNSGGLPSAAKDPNLFHTASDLLPRDRKGSISAIMGHHLMGSHQAPPMDNTQGNKGGGNSTANQGTGWAVPTSLEQVTLLDVRATIQEVWEPGQRLTAEEDWNDWLRRFTKEDWNDWLRRFMLGILKESPSVALRYCVDLQDYFPLVRELFNACFLSVWTRLKPPTKAHFLKTFTSVISASNVPPEVLQTLLNLAEFMDHELGSFSKNANPMKHNIELLGETAKKGQAYAKALRYKEELFTVRPTEQLIEDLISLNNLLGQPAAAQGVFVHAKEQHNLQAKESWYEKLHDWPSALRIYEEKSASPHDHIEAKVRCLHALGDWKKLQDLVLTVWPDLQPAERLFVAPKAATAAWNMLNWRALERFAEGIEPASLHHHFFHAVLAINANKFDKAQKLISQARDIVDTEVTALFGESYSRAYSQVVQMQQLIELEEVIEYKKAADFPEARENTQHRWERRLDGCQRDVETWQAILAVHNLVLDPAQLRGQWLKFARICRRSSRPHLADAVLKRMLMADEEMPVSEPDTTENDENNNSPAKTTDKTAETSPLKNSDKTNNSDKKTAPATSPDKSSEKSADKTTTPEKRSSQDSANINNSVHKSINMHVNISTEGKTFQLQLEKKDKALVYGFLKHQWYTGGAAAKQQALGQLKGLRVPADKKLQARIFQKTGEWQMESSAKTEVSISESIRAFRAATTYDPTSYKSWHSLALAHFELISGYERTALPAVQKEQRIAGLVAEAIHGFFTAISLSPAYNLQDTLRVLMLWFKYGDTLEAQLALHEGFGRVPIETWLQVIPQIIARISIDKMIIRRLVQDLLTNIGKEHPQALVFPLFVQSRSGEVKAKAVKPVVDNIRLHNPRLMAQAFLFSEEVVRASILWYEMWYGALDEASKYHFHDKRPEVAIATLKPKHMLLERGPQTLSEKAFFQQHARDLREAAEWTARYEVSGHMSDLHQAWDLYHTVFRDLKPRMQRHDDIQLEHVSPLLLEARDMELAVPGTYTANQPVVRISRVQPVLKVFSTKQRPRQLFLTGSDGSKYCFLLKGHEDLRQDERVMQLFGLVNSLLASTFETSRSNLSIQRYSVVPLSPESGLLGWVPNCDPLADLIRRYREATNNSPGLEQRNLLMQAGDFIKLAPIQKVDIFSQMLKDTEPQAQDLQNILWLQSGTSEVWLERRTNYARSLAVMSMVGYILGLGDRHCSNLLLSQASGKIVHIDFGDCFEAAMERDKFPEKVPFRLTRMLVCALGPSGIEGNFRQTCESVMHVLRENKESLMAVLQAFVYDPLISWRLLTETTSASKKTHHSLATLEATTIDTSTSAPLHLQETPLSVRAAPVVWSHTEVINEKAKKITTRIENKLTGRDFFPKKTLTVPDQVDLLIKQATSVENICVQFIGWNPFY